jgi:hypothetical protein
MDKWAYKGNNAVLGVTVKYKHDVDMFWFLNILTDALICWCFSGTAYWELSMHSRLTLLRTVYILQIGLNSTPYVTGVQVQIVHSWLFCTLCLSAPWYMPVFGQHSRIQHGESLFQSNSLPGL